MKKLLLLVLVLAFALSGVFVSNVFAAEKLNPTPEKPAILRISCALSPGYSSSLSTIEWCKYIEANSGGRIKTQFFDSGSLYSQSNALEALMMGMCEGAIFLPTDFTKILPEWNIVQVSAILDTPEHYAKIADGEVGARLFEGLETKGLKGIALIPNGGYGKNGPGFVTKCYPIKVPADFAGLKIRTAQPTEAALIAKYGGVPVTLPGGDVFMALQLGTIDGTTCGLNHFSQRKFQETGAIYYAASPLKGRVFYSTVLNKDFFDKLPSDLQILLLESGKRIIDVGYRQGAVEVDEVNNQYAVDHGVLIYEVTPEDTAAWKVDFDLDMEALKADNPGSKELFEMIEEIRRQ